MSGAGAVGSSWKVKVLLVSAIPSQQKVMGMGVGGIAIDFHIIFSPFLVQKRLGPKRAIF